MTEQKWEVLLRNSENVASLRRIEVPGGWLYERPSHSAMCFVPKSPEGHDAPIRVCDHGFRADSCPGCFPRGSS